MKIWEKPKLIVLVRGRPEEAILVNCKTDTIIMGPYEFHQGCNNAWDAYLQACIPWFCEDLVSSQGLSRAGKTHDLDERGGGA